MAFDWTYAMLKPSFDHVGCDALTPDCVMACTPLPSAPATWIRPPLTPAMRVASADQDGCVSPVRSVFCPVPSAATVQMSEPHVYAISPLSPKNVPPRAD